MEYQAGGGKEAARLSRPADSWTLPQFFDSMTAAGREFQSRIV